VRDGVAYCRNVGTIFQREFIAYFLSPVAYIVAFLFISFNNFLGFGPLMDYLRQPGFRPIQPGEVFVGCNVVLFLLPFLAPLLTMGLLAGERRSGTIEMLLTAPVSETQVVLGKYLASLALYIVLSLPSLAYVYVLGKYGSPDYWTLASGYLGMVLVGAMCLSIGLLASSLTRDQIVAAILGLLPLAVIWFLPMLVKQLLYEQVKTGRFDYAVAFLNVLDHVQLDFSTGIIDTRHVVLYVSVITLMLFVTVRIVETTKGR